MRPGAEEVLLSTGASGGGLNRPFLSQHIRKKQRGRFECADFYPISI